jgi:hypothetical protein
VTDARYTVAYRDGLRALDQDALLSARASFNECLRLAPNDPAAMRELSIVAGRQIAESFRANWMPLTGIYTLVLLLMLFLGLRRLQKSARITS